MPAAAQVWLALSACPERVIRVLAMWLDGHAVSQLARPEASCGVASESSDARQQKVCGQVMR